jgi:hypothetical protein
MKTKQEIWDEIQDTIQKSNPDILNRISDAEKSSIRNFLEGTLFEALYEIEKMKEHVIKNPEAQAELAKALSASSTLVSTESNDEGSTG